MIKKILLICVVLFVLLVAGCGLTPGKSAFVGKAISDRCVGAWCPTKSISGYESGKDVEWDYLPVEEHKPARGYVSGNKDAKWTYCPEKLSAGDECGRVECTATCPSTTKCATGNYNFEGKACLGVDGFSCSNNNFCATGYSCQNNICKLKLKSR